MDRWMDGWMDRRTVNAKQQSQGRYRKYTLKQTPNREASRLKTALEDHRAKLAESQKYLASSQQVVSWLNKELNELQMGGGRRPLPASSTPFTFRSDKVGLIWLRVCVSPCPRCRSHVRCSLSGSLAPSLMDTRSCTCRRSSHFPHRRQHRRCRDAPMQILGSTACR